MTFAVAAVFALGMLWTRGPSRFMMGAMAAALALTAIVTMR